MRLGQWQVGTREVLLLEFACVQREQTMSPDQITPKQIEPFCAALREKWLADSPFKKPLLQILVTEIRGNKEDAGMKGGSYAKPADSVAE